MHTRKSVSLSKGAIALAVALSLGAPLVGVSAATAAPASAAGPELRIFPSTVVQDIQRLGQDAAQIEQGLQPEIEDMERLMGLIKASQCEGATDPGCAEMQRQLADRYKAMLAKMDELLPSMQEGVKRVRGGLEKRIASQLGHSTSASGLQAMLMESGPRTMERPRYQVPGASRLAARFQQYHRLVAGGMAAGRGSLALVAADVYRDMAESEQLIAMIRDQIARSMLHLEVTQVMPGITPEMELTVASAKSLIFGESAEVAALPAPAGGGVGDPAGAYRSPLEL